MSGSDWPRLGSPRERVYCLSWPYDPRIHPWGRVCETSFGSWAEMFVVFLRVDWNEWKSKQMRQLSENYFTLSQSQLLLCLQNTIVYFLQIPITFRLNTKQWVGGWGAASLLLPPCGYSHVLHMVYEVNRAFTTVTSAQHVTVGTVSPCLTMNWS